MKCIKCNAVIANGTQQCPNCGAEQPNVETISPYPQNSMPGNNAVSHANMQKTIKCPKCGGTNLQAISDVKGEGAKLWKLCCCGFLGLCGVGKTTTQHFWICANCGNKFKV